MIKKICFTILSAVIFLFTTLSCSSSALYDSIYPTLRDGQYDSEFPYKNSSKQLEEISGSIRLVNSIAFYTSYVFNETSKFRASDVGQINFSKAAIEQINFNRTASGTSTVIFEDQGTVALLSVAHIISFPDTIISHFINPDGSFSQFIQSVSIKTKQTIYIPDFPDNGEVDIILIDKVKDVALLGRHFSFDKTISMPVFKYPWGKSSELEWGSFVYVFGFPMNYKMISKAIVSSPGKENHTFLIDAVFNRGYSGGIVLAIRDGVPNFELVGLVRSVPSEYQYTIRPLAKEQDFDFNPMLPFKGDVYVDREQVLRTGITKVIGIEIVKDFIVAHKEELIEKGYLLKDLFNVPDKLKLKINN
ncbi:MAG: serine protease [Ignavibacteriales bacterium]|nr:serine protease [Ignavibacteriales bacterium]